MISLDSNTNTAAPELHSFLLKQYFCLIDSSERGALNCSVALICFGCFAVLEWLLSLLQ